MEQSEASLPADLFCHEAIFDEAERGSFDSLRAAVFISDDGRMASLAKTGDQNRLIIESRENSFAGTVLSNLTVNSKGELEFLVMERETDLFGFNKDAFFSVTVTLP